MFLQLKATKSTNSQFSSQYVIYLFQFCLLAGYIFVPFRTLHIYISFKIIKQLFIHLLGNKINISHPLLDFDLTFSKIKIFKGVIKSNKALRGRISWLTNTSIYANYPMCQSDIHT